MPSTFAIGRANEKRSIDRDKAAGWEIYKPTRSRFSWMGNTDIWNLFDYQGRRPHQPLLVVQVKTNHVATDVLRDLISAQHYFNLEQQARDGSYLRIADVYLDVWSKPKHRWQLKRYDVDAMRVLLQARLARQSRGILRQESQTTE